MKDQILIKDQREIRDLLKKCHITKSKFVLWQIVDGKRIILPSVIHEMNLAANALIFAPESNWDDFQFDEKHQLYCHSSKRNLLFKKYINQMNSKKILIDLPREAFVTELRRHPRSTFGLDSKHYSFVVDYAGQMTNSQHFKMKIFDISQGGVSFLINAQEEAMFLKKEKVTIQTIGKMRLKVPLRGRVAHKTNLYLKEDNVLRTFTKMGVKFDQEIGQGVYMSLLENVLNMSPFSSLSP